MSLEQRIKNMADRAESVLVGVEMDVRPQSWDYVRIMPKNLGL